MKGFNLWGLIAVMACAQPAWGASITADAINRGYFMVTGFHNPSSKNTLTGFLPVIGGSPSVTTRSLFVWDLASVNGQVNSAVLRLELEMYLTPSTTRSFDIYDVQTDPAMLDISYAASDVTGLGIYSDLGSGGLFGSATVRASDVGTILQIPLSADAITDLNLKQGGLFAVGVRLRDPFWANNYDFVRFSDVDEPRTHQLVLDVTPASAAPPAAVVPEPSAGQIGLGLLLVLSVTKLLRYGQVAKRAA